MKKIMGVVLMAAGAVLSVVGLMAMFATDGPGESILYAGLLMIGLVSAADGYVVFRSDREAE